MRTQYQTPTAVCYKIVVYLWCTYVHKIIIVIVIASATVVLLQQEMSVVIDPCSAIE